MEMFEKFKSSKSIASRLTARISATIFLVMTITSVIMFGLLWLSTVVLFNFMYRSSLNISQEQMDNTFNTIEVAVTNNIAEVEHNLNDPQKLYTVVSRIVSQNPDIVGSSIAFRPGYIKGQKEAFAPYAYMDSIRGLQTKLLAENYPEQDWFKKAMDKGTGFWSDPYMDRGGSEMAMVTYSQPLYDNDGEFYAVLTADLSLDKIAQIREIMDSLNNESLNPSFDIRGHSYSFIISKDGTYIAHPNKQLVMKKNAVSVFKQSRTTKDDSIPQYMMEGKEDINTLWTGSQPCNIIYGPIERTGWSMAFVVPLSDLYTPANIFVCVFAFLMIVGLIIVILVCRATIKHTTKPLTLFAHSADEIAQGNFEADLPQINTEDEMKRLRDSFELMQASLIKQIEETKIVNKEKGRLDSELQIAHNIQMTMIPKVFPERKDMNMFAQLTPAKEVGGDLYDFYIRDEKLFFCIGDVSGKGIPAAMVMGVTKTLFRTLSAHESNPAKIVTRMNEAIGQNNEVEMFVTFFLGVLDLPSGRLHYCNAAHCPPVLMGSGTGLLPVVPNIPLGVEEKYKYQGQDALINDGTIIIFYTDGLTEAENTKHELYGEERLSAIAATIYERQIREPRQVMQLIDESVKMFVGEAEQSDDYTLMGIQFLHEQKNKILERSLTLPNDIETIPQLSEFIDMVAEEASLPAELSMSLNLAIEEAVVNVMNYAYPQGKRGDVNIDMSVDNEQLTVVISDKGMPFDPTSKAEADTTLSAEERPIGGLGIFLVRQLMDSINYERTEGKNRLTLIKKLT